MHGWNFVYWPLQAQFSDINLVGLAHIYHGWCTGTRLPQCEWCNLEVYEYTPLTTITNISMRKSHDDVIKWKYFPHYWLSVRGIQRSLVKSPHKGQWSRTLMFSSICSWTNGWDNSRDACDFRRHRAHHDVTVMVYAITVMYCCRNSLILNPTIPNVTTVCKMEMRMANEHFLYI